MRTVWKVRTTHLLAIYLSLLALGVLVELELPIEPPILLNSLPLEDVRKSRQPFRDDTRLQHLSDHYNTPSTLLLPNVSEPGTDFDFSPRLNYDELLTTSYNPFDLYIGMYGVSVTARAYVDAHVSQFVSDRSVLIDNQNSDSRHKTKSDENVILRKYKFSTEVNAYDELAYLLTTSKTHCLTVESVSQPRHSSGGSRYRCSIHIFSECERKTSWSKTKKFGKRCSRDTRPAYKVHPASERLTKTNSNGTFPTKTEYKIPDLTEIHPIKVNPMKAQKSWTEGVTSEGEATHHTVTVDAHYTFLKNLKTLGSHQRLLLHTIFDLAGLNSLHRYEIIRRLVQVMSWVLSRRGYQLVHSSAKVEDLLQYLQQEGLQRPLLVLTLWHLQ
nr:uncharacterized protein LOC128703816 [Cherax quadricarinatus]